MKQYPPTNMTENVNSSNIPIIPETLVNPTVYIHMHTYICILELK